MAAIIEISEFVDKILKSGLPLLDARSEGEYNRAHIPGAVNLPLLKNEERVIVGTLFKKEGREEAVKKGFELVGPRFAGIISQAEKISSDKKVLLYCWRGGMRSNIIAWLLNMAGFQVFLLKGGYKSYRNWAQQQFNIRKNIVVIGGKTGSGKTDLLKALGDDGEQIIDLEGIAHHKGSAFGALGQLPQPSNEQFENILALQWFYHNDEQIIWMENESRSVGSNIIPLGIYEQMRNTHVIEISLKDDIRKKRIINEYGIYSKEVLAENTKKTAKRLGGQRLKEAIGFLEDENTEGWVDIMLEYYDQTYDHSNTQRDRNKVIKLELSHDRMNEHVLSVVSAVKEKLLIKNL